MRYYFQAISIFALQLLRDFPLGTLISKSLKIVKIHTLTAPKERFLQLQFAPRGKSLKDCNAKIEID